MKLNAKRLLIFCLILALSVGFGFAWNGIATAIEKKNHPLPRDLHPIISACAEEFGVPETVILAVVRSESEFVSSKVGTEGKIGLMQISPERLSFVYETVLAEETPTEGLLYDPRTNLRVGTAYLSYLYQKYGMWEPVFAAWHAGEVQTDLWLADPECLNDQGRLTNIPDRETQSFVDELLRAGKLYTSLYFEHTK